MDVIDKIITERFETSEIEIMREFLKPAPMFQTAEFKTRKMIVEKLMNMETYKRKQIIDVIRLQDKTSISFNDSVASIADDDKKYQWRYI